MEGNYLSSLEKDTKALAQKLVNHLKDYRSICLWGGLAAGKTTFTQGIAEAFGLKRLTSPTFLIMKEYPVSNHDQITRLYHLDLYRLDDYSDLKALSLDEILLDPKNLVVIEWPEKIKDQLPSHRIDISLREKAQNEREINILYHS